MPELPEVETMVRDLEPRVIGRRIAEIEASFPGIVVYPAYREFRQRLIGEEIDSIRRRGKFAVFGLTSGDALIVHRGMTGSLLHRASTDPPERHLRLLFRLDNDIDLRFDDQRKFGKVYLMEATGAERPLPWDDFGPEPLSAAFTRDVLGASLANRTAVLKPLLLSQRIVAGLGNIYVDEALFRAGVHPERRAGTLTRDEVQRLHTAIIDVLRAAVEGRGTTFDSYVDIEGRQGTYQRSLRVFNRRGDPCSQCGTSILKTIVGGRGTYYCPVCQEA